MATSEPSQKQRMLWAKMGWALPDGSYYIRPLAQGGAQDVQNAVLAIGRAKPGPNQSQTVTQAQTAARRHVIARAKVLNLSSKIPATWNADGTLKPTAAAQSATTVDEFFEHFGVKGMKWGRRKDSAPKAPASEESTKTTETRAKAKASGSSSLSNKELQDAVTRLNLERQYASLTTSDLSVGKRLALEITGTGGSIAKQQANQVAQQQSAKLVKKLIENAG